MTSNRISAVRFLFAACLAPIIGSVAYLLFLIFLTSSGRPLTSWDFSYFGLSIYFGAIVGLPTMLFIGLPLHAAICRLGVRNVPNYFMAGAVSGFVATCFYFLYSVDRSSLSDFWITALFLGGPTGAISALSFHFLRGPLPNLTR